MERVLIIAEAGVNHNGKLDLAYKLCDAAKEAGVDIIEFQTWNTDWVITKNTRMAEYQAENLSSSESQYEMLKKLELSYAHFRMVKEHCDNIGISFLSTADERESLDFLIGMGLDLVKLGSGEITNIPYLRYVGGLNLPMILSTGMSNLAQVATAYDTLVNAGAKDISILHCTTNYPCPMDEVNLKAMCTLRDAFKCPVGYSDHTMGTEVSVAAAALGAEIIEKHFTLDRTMVGPDHKASLEPAELKLMVQQIRNIEYALGDGIKRPNRSEVENAKVVLKSILAKRPIKKGEYLTSDNLVVKRASSGISAAHWDIVIGTKALFDYEIDDPIKLY